MPAARGPPGALAHYLHTPLSEEERALLDALLDALETHELPGITALVAAISWPKYVEGVSNLAHKIVDLTDARALVLLVEMDRRVFCVVRSRTPALRRGRGGRGTRRRRARKAASAIYRGPIAEARARALAALPAAVTDPLRARDVMSKPLAWFRRATPLPGDGALPALQPERRARDRTATSSSARPAEDLDQAIGHGLSHAPVKGIMSAAAGDARGCTPSELQQLLADSAPGRIAIVDGEAVAGVVTRRDVLRALDEAAERRRRDRGVDRGRARGAAPPRASFGAIAAASEGVEGVYLVGGTVRDILLGERASTSTSPSRATRSRSRGGSHASSTAARAST